MGFFKSKKDSIISDHFKLIEDVARNTFIKMLYAVSLSNGYGNC